MRDFIGVGIAGILLIIGAMLLAPFLGFVIAYICGWFAKIVIGDQLVKGFFLLGIIITKEEIPLIAGCLGWIGGFFKTNIYTKSHES